MALQEMLSALRQLIMDERSLPLTERDRLAQYRRLFPNMNQAEVEDLARISPEQLRVYTKTIFAGERSLLKNLFPLVFARLEQVWIARTGESLNATALIRDVHDNFPWKGNATRDLVSNFVEYLLDFRRDLHSAAPDLPDLVMLELRSFEIARVPDGMWSLAPRADSEDLSNISVGELLERYFIVPASSSSSSFSYDVLSVRDLYYSKLRLPPNGAEKSEVFAFGGRSARYQVTWERLRRSVYEYLRVLEPEEPKPLADLAQVILTAHPEAVGGSDRAQFELFIKELQRLLSAGIIALPAGKYMQ